MTRQKKIAIGKRTYYVTNICATMSFIPLLDSAINWIASVYGVLKFHVYAIYIQINSRIT
jgi:hypothetical protein